MARDCVGNLQQRDAGADMACVTDLPCANTAPPSSVRKRSSRSLASVAVFASGVQLGQGKLWSIESSTDRILVIVSVFSLGFRLFASLSSSDTTLDCPVLSLA